MQVAFAMPASMEAIDPMAQSLREVAEPYLDAEMLFGFEVSVSEALTNIVKHSYGPDAANGNVQITLHCDGAAVSLELQDQGKPARADLYRNVPRLEDIDVLSESGRGLALIKHYTDALSFWSDQTGNHLSLTFKSKDGGRP